MYKLPPVNRFCINVVNVYTLLFIQRYAYKYMMEKYFDGTTDNQQAVT